MATIINLQVPVYIQSQYSHPSVKLNLIPLLKKDVSLLS